MNKKSKWIVAALLTLLLGAGAWAYRSNSVDPAVAALEAQRSRMMSGEATEQEHQAFREQIGQLTDDQRRQLFERGRPEMQKRMAQRMNDLFGQTPEQIRAEARQRAADIVAARRQREANGDTGRGGPPGGPGGRAGGAPEGGPGRDGPGRDGPPEGRRPRTESERDARAKQRLDFVDPSTRAQFSEFRKMINDELEAKGQEPLSRRDMREVFRGGRS